MKPQPGSRHPVPGPSVERLSVSISSDDKAALERIAEEKRVSLAWVLRDAVTRYLADQGTPPLGNDRLR